MNRSTNDFTYVAEFKQTGNSPKVLCVQGKKQFQDPLKTIFNSLPYEICHHIFTLLSIKDSSSLAFASRATNALFKKYIIDLSKKFERENFIDFKLSSYVCLRLPVIQDSKFLVMKNCPDTVPFLKQLETLTSLKKIDLEVVCDEIEPSELFESLNKLTLLENITIRFDNRSDNDYFMIDLPKDELITYDKAENFLTITHVSAYHMEELFLIEKFKTIKVLKIDTILLPLHSNCFPHFSSLETVLLVNTPTKLLWNILVNIYSTPSVVSLEITTSDLGSSATLTSQAALKFARSDIVVNIVKYEK